MIWWIHIQWRIAAVSQSPTGLWYTCIHAKQLQRNPMYMWVENINKYSLFLRQCNVYHQPAESQSKKGAKKYFFSISVFFWWKYWIKERIPSTGDEILSATQFPLILCIVLTFCLESSPFGLKEVKVTHCVFQRKK